MRTNDHGEEKNSKKEAELTRRGVGRRRTFFLVQIEVDVLLALNSWRVPVIGQPVAFPVFMIVEERSGGLGGREGRREGGEQEKGGGEESKEKAGQFSFLFFKSKL